MSEDEKPARIAGHRKVHPGMIAAVVAVLVLALMAALYAFSGSFGNGEPADSASAACTIDDEMKAKLDAAAQGQVAAFSPLDRGLSVATLGFNDKDGNALKLADWSGRMVLLNLWATWCAPCRAEMPALEQLNQELGGEKFEVVPVSMDLGGPEKPKAFYDEIKLTGLRFFHDPEMTLLTTLKPEGVAFGLPATLLIDGRGCVLGSLSGPAAWESDDAKALVKAAL